MDQWSDWHQASLHTFNNSLCNCSKSIEFSKVSKYADNFKNLLIQRHQRSTWVCSLRLQRLQRTHQTCESKQLSSQVPQDLINLAFVASELHKWTTANDWWAVFCLMGHMLHKYILSPTTVFPFGMGALCSVSPPSPFICHSWEYFPPIKHIQMLCVCHNQ